MDIRRTNEFADWLKRLRDANARARINLRIDRITMTGNLGDVESVGDDVSELKIDYGPGYRLYFAYRGKEVVLLLVGGDKSAQQKDIERAQKLNREYE